jgi:hypothetical protein
MLSCFKQMLSSFKHFSSTQTKSFRYIAPWHGESIPSPISQTGGGLQRVRRRLLRIMPLKVAMWH